MQLIKLVTIVALVAVATATQHEVPEAGFLEFEDPMLPAWGDSGEVDLMELSKGKAAKAQSNKRIVANIRDLLAFAMGVQDAHFKSKASRTVGMKSRNPIVKIVLQMAQTRKKWKNMVWRYVNEMDALRAHFTHGIGNYLLSHLNRAIVYGKGAVKISKVGDHFYAKLTHQALGLRILPSHLEDMKVLQHKYASFCAGMSTKGAAHAATAACLYKKRLRSYKSFYADIRATRNSKVVKDHKKLAAGALKQITKTKSVTSKPDSGVKGAKATRQKTGALHLLPTPAMKKKAKKLASAWAKKHGHCGKMADILSGREAAEKVIAAKKAIKEKAAKKKAAAKAKAAKAAEKKVKKGFRPGLYKILTTGVHKGASAAQPAGWGLSAWHAHGAVRNHASSWAAVHSGNYWPMVWDIQPSKRTKGAFTIKTTKYGPAGGKQPAGWGLSSWNAHGAKRNSASSRVAVHSGNHWLMDWTIKPATRTKGAWTIKTTGVHAKTGKQPAGWGLSAWQKHGGKRNHASSWVYTHAGSHWLMDWKLVRVTKAQAAAHKKAAAAKEAAAAKKAAAKAKAAQAAEKKVKKQPVKVQIKATHGKCLDASQRNRTGGKVHMWNCNTANKNQHWTYTKATGQIKATHGKCLDASQRNRTGGKVHMWNCNTANKNQHWTLTPRRL